MRIGLVGAKIWIKETIKRISQDFPDIQFIAFPYNNVLDLPAVLEGKQYMCDYFLFAGDTARRWAETKIKPIVPWFSIPRSTSPFLESWLWHLYRVIPQGLSPITPMKNTFIMPWTKRA